MKNLSKISKSINWKSILLIILTISLLLPEMAEARRGSFGGRSFGGRSFFKSRSFSKPKSSPNSSFSKSKPKSSFGKPNSPMQSNVRKPSFGGISMSKQQAQAKYGIPRKVIQKESFDNFGNKVNYRFNDFGGFGSGLMAGYMLGHRPWYWSTPFSPAFYYGQPVYVHNPDGTVDVYPPTFSFGKLIISLIIIAAIIFIIVRLIQMKRRNSISNSNFGSFGD